MTSRTITREDCSELGLLILDYMERHHLSFQQVACQLNVSRTSLRIACHQDGNPGSKLIPKLAQLLNKTEAEITQLIDRNNSKIALRCNEAPVTEFPIFSQFPSLFVGKELRDYFKSLNQ